MSNKVRRNIYIDKDKWESLPKYIDCSRSEWIEKQIIKQISCNDSVKELEMKIDNINKTLQKVQFEKKNAEDLLEQMKLQRDLNDKNFELIEEAMKLVRLVNQNEGAIEENRIIFIADSKKISPQLILDKAKADSTIKILR